MGDDMADDAAHIAAEPRSHNDDADTDATADASEDLVGTRSRELVAVGSADTGASASQSRGASSPWSAPPSDIVDDAPRWSFPGVAAEPSPLPAADGSQSELPFAAAAPALAPPRPMPLFGPVGRTRSTVLVPLASALTLGVYALVWHHDINRELEEFDPKLHSRPRRSMVALLIPWLAGLLLTLAGAALILISRFHVHLPFDPHVTTTQAWYMLAGLVVVPYLVLLVPFSVVAVVMTLERLRSVEEHVGATTDRQVRPVGTSLLLAIPLAGGLALLALEQRRLNAIWETVTPSGHLKS
jgi:hypothetical protein